MESLSVDCLEALSGSSLVHLKAERLEPQMVDEKEYWTVGNSVRSWAVPMEHLMVGSKERQWAASMVRRLAGQSDYSMVDWKVHTMAASTVYLRAVC